MNKKEIQNCSKAYWQYREGKLTQEEYHKILKKNGYNDENTQKLIRANKVKMPTVVLHPDNPLVGVSSYFEKDKQNEL